MYFFGRVGFNAMCGDIFKKNKALHDKKSIF